MDKISSMLREYPQFEEGCKEAELQIAEGKLGYRIQGKVVWPICDEVARILLDRYGIYLQVDGHCIGFIEEAASSEGYNGRMIEEFNKRFGENVVESVFREVERKQKKRKR